KDFLDLMLPYAGSMPLPTRLIPERYHSLNAISFREYLDRYLYLSPEFLMRVDYQMLDDYGGTTSQVSALAGIHYYQCRPYEATTGVELFSPPEGNHYFIRKLASRLPADQLLTGHLVTQLIPTGQGVEAQVLDVQAQTRKRVRARQVVYAGQKHALNYVYPQDATRFSGNEYAPWFVINLVLDRPLTDEAYWQNEVIRPETRMLGFVNSHAQQRAPEDPQVLTIYYCYPPEYRHYLTNLEAESRQLIQSSLRELAQFFGYPIDAQVREAFVSLMGHAMPIPKPGYLLQDPNAQRADQRVAYAGVDTGRLPLFFEALDSGIMAARALG
ncbi:MAG: FAD-dependent oxidoreductase, partial [Bacteroidota bacterium]